MCPIYSAAGPQQVLGCWQREDETVSQLEFQNGKSWGCRHLQPDTWTCTVQRALRAWRKHLPSSPWPANTCGHVQHQTKAIRLYKIYKPMLVDTICKFLEDNCGTRISTEHAPAA